MERSQDVLALWRGRGRKGRGGRSKICFKTASVTCHPHLGEEQPQGSLGGRANRKVSLWHLEASNLIQGPQKQILRTKLCGGGEGNELCKFQSPPCPALSPGASMLCHCKQTAWGSLPGEITRVFVSLGGFYQSYWTRPWVIFLLLTWISGAGPGSHLNSLDNHFSSCLTKTFEKISQSEYHPYLVEKENEMQIPLNHTSASLSSFPRQDLPSAEINMTAYGSTLENPLCNNLLQVTTTEPICINAFKHWELHWLGNTKPHSQ